jgi:transcriptional regulator with XRE-family HTH domain
VRVRKLSTGDRNIVGAFVARRRKELNIKQKDLLSQLQIMGIDLNSSGLSKIEGQIRSVADYELRALAEVLGCTMLEMFEEEEPAAE